MLVELMQKNGDGRRFEWCRRHRKEQRSQGFIVWRRSPPDRYGRLPEPGTHIVMAGQARGEQDKRLDRIAKIHGVSMRGTRVRRVHRPGARLLDALFDG